MRWVDHPRVLRFISYVLHSVRESGPKRFGLNSYPVAVDPVIRITTRQAVLLHFHVSVCYEVSPCSIFYSFRRLHKTY